MKSFIQGIDHVQVAAPVGCEEEARAFYGKKIGMEEIPKPEELKKRGGRDVGLSVGIKKSILVWNRILHQLKRHIQLFM
ncbi:plasmid stability protein [Bacillus toyonensis]